MVKFQTIFIAFGISLVVGLSLLLASSNDPELMLKAFFTKPFTSPNSFSAMLSNFALVLLCALGFSITFKAGLMNLGGSGQVTIGGLVALIVSLQFSQLGFPFSSVLGGGLAFIVAAILGVVIALLKLYVRISEIISSFLISLGIIALVNYLINHQFDDPQIQTIQSLPISHSFSLPGFGFDSYMINLSVIGSIAVAVFVWLILRHTLFGYDLRTISNNTEFSKTQGIPIPIRIILTFGLSAGFHGLAGATYLYDAHNALSLNFGMSIAWAGVSASLLSRGHPIGAILSSFIIAFIDMGTQNARIFSDISLEIGIFMQALFFIFITTKIGKSKYA